MFRRFIPLFLMICVSAVPSLSYAVGEVAQPHFYPARVIMEPQTALNIFPSLLGADLFLILLMVVTGIFTGFTLIRQEWNDRIENGCFVFYFLGTIGLYIAQNIYTTLSSPLILSLIDGGLIFMVLAGLWIAQYFLQLSRRSYLEQIMFLVVAGFVLISGLAAILTSQDNMLLSSVLLFVPAVIAMIVIAILSMFQRERLGRSIFFFSMGWVALSLGTIVSALVQARLIPASPLTIHAFWIALIAQAGLFTLAVMLRHKIHSDEQQQKRTRDIQNAMAKERLKKAKESVDQTRLIRVIEREREIMDELRQREMQRTEDMRAARDMADKSNEAKSAFLALMSHEIRTPLNGIIGTMKMLQDTSLDGKQKDLVCAMHESSDSIIALLSDILDFEKIQQGHMDIEVIDFDLANLLKTLTIIMTSNAENKGLKLLVEIDEDVPHYVQGDPLRLRQILTNLLSNAIKFTKDGHVKLSVKMGEQPVQIKTKPRSKIIFSVEDTGVGISQENQKNIFKPFQQADKTVARKYGGSGLGLAISKKLVEGMGGNLSLKSEEGQGTKFFFGLNMDHAENTALLNQEREQKMPNTGASNKSKITSDTKPMRVLVVDDNELNRKVVSSFLQNDGHTVFVSDSGEDAVKQCQLKSFDIIFLDIWMGGISGFETVRIIRALPNHENHLTPIVAITGSATTDTVKRIEESGIEAYIEKPVNYEMLVDILHRFSTNKKQESAISAGNFKRKEEKKVASKAPAIQNFVKSNMAEQEQKVSIKSFPQDLFDRALLQSLDETLKKEDFQNLIKEYMNKANEIITIFQEFDADISSEDIFARAHEIKGMAANFGMSGVSMIAGKMEKLAQDKDNIQALKMIPDLEVANTKTNEILKNFLKT